MIIKRFHYVTQQFANRGRYPVELTRLRPVVAVGFTSRTTIGTSVTIAPGVPPRNVNMRSLALLGSLPSTDDTNENDYFLPPFDNGHLIGSQYGGSDGSFNLVPMLRSSNRGGGWATFESASADHAGGGVVVIRLHYGMDGIDPRIPSHVEGVFIPLPDTAAAAFETAFGARMTAVATAASLAAYNTLANTLRVQLNTDLGITLHPATITSGSFAQQVMAERQPYYALANEEEFRANLVEAVDYVVTNGWRVETDPRYPFRLRPVPVPDTLTVDSERRMPPLAFRPYACLDYLLLEGKLNGALIGAADATFDTRLEPIYNNATFTDPMKSLAMHANHFFNHFRMRDQIGLLSDVRFYTAHPDPGGIGEGIVLEPEFDHVIPRNPDDLGPHGLTIFSNLQIVSARYNSQKSGHLWVPPDTLICLLYPRARPKRKALTLRPNYKHMNDSKGAFDPEEARRKRYRATLEPIREADKEEEEEEG